MASRASKTNRRHPPDEIFPCPLNWHWILQSLLPFCVGTLWFKGTTADDQQTPKVIRQRAAGVFHERPGSVGKLLDVRSPSNIYGKRSRAGYKTGRTQPHVSRDQKVGSNNELARIYRTETLFFLTNPLDKHLRHFGKRSLLCCFCCKGNRKRACCEYRNYRQKNGHCSD